MGVKYKILTTITFICMAIMLTLVGIWAVADLGFAVGGDITYEAPKGGYSVTMSFMSGGTTDISVSKNGEDFIVLSDIPTNPPPYRTLENVETLIIKNLSQYDCEITCYSGEFPETLIKANSQTPVIYLTQNVGIRFFIQNPEHT